MRLTLRTLLAYMDDILDPSDQEELGRKIEASPFATELIHRSRDAVRRLRLSAPEPLAGDEGDLHGGDHNLDANTAAEYLDNTLSPDDVADFERACLEAGPQADMLLAETASCHHILTLVLGEPAEVDADMRQRMYELERFSAAQQLRVEPAHRAREVQPTEPATAVAASRPRVDAVAPTVPDYMLEAARVRRRARRRLAALCMAAAVGAVGTYVFWPVETKLPDQVADGEMGDVDDLTSGFVVGEDDASARPSEQNGATEGADAGGEAPAWTPDGAALPTPSDRDADEAADEAAGTLETASPGGAEPPEVVDDAPGATPGDAGATAEETASGDDHDADAGAVEPELPLADETSGEVPDADETPTGATVDGEPTAVPPPIPSPDAPLVTIETPANSDFPATADDQPAGSPAADGTELLPGDAGALESGALGADAGAASQPRQLGAYLGLNNDLLLRFDSTANGWVRLAPRSTLSAGDRLLALPACRTHVVLGSDVNAYIGGGTELVVLAPGQASGDSRSDFGIAVPFGRIIINSGQSGNRIEVALGDESRVIVLGPSSSLALEVRRTFVPGSDATRTPAPLEASWYLTSGSVEWGDAGRSAEGQATWTTVDGVDQAAETIDELPEWINREPTTNLETGARDALADALANGQPVSVPLLELAGGKGLGRRTEVRALAARAAAYVGEFEPLVKALADLTDPGARNRRKEQVEALRSAIARDPAIVDVIRDAFALQRGSEAADDLMEMLLGYSSEAIGVSRDEVKNGALVRLINWLEHDDLTYRVLASYNINEITGTSYLGGYRPEHPAAQRRREVRFYWDRLDKGDLMPRETAP